jgi:hypothetical protein
VALDVSVKDFTEATVACEELARRLSNLPLGKRLRFRKEAAYYRRMGALYRQQANEAGLRVPAVGRLD